MTFMPDPVLEADAGACIARKAKCDPHIWFLEIDNRDGRHFLATEVDTGVGGLIP